MPASAPTGPATQTSTQNADGTFTLSAAAPKPVDNTVVPASPSSSPLIVTSGQSRTQYNNNVSQLNQVTGQGMPSATAPGQSTAAQNGSTMGSTNTTSNGTSAASSPTPPDPTKVPAGWDATSYANFKAANPNLEPNAQDTANMQAAATTPSGMDLIDPVSKQLLQNNITDLQSQADQAKAQVDAATATLNNDPAAIAAAASIKAQYDQLVQAMIDKNKLVIGGANLNAARTGAMQYAPDMNSLFMNDAMQRAQQRVTDLQSQEADLINKSNAAYKSGDVSALNSAMASYNQANKDKMDAVNKLLDAAHTATVDAQAQAKDARDFAYQQQQDAQAEKDKIAATVSSVQSDAAKAGAPDSVLKAIAGAPDQTSAILAAGQYLQTSSNPDVAQYLFYKQQATAAGQEPISYAQYQTQQTQLANSNAYSKAYATAAGSAAGAASIVAPTIDPSTPGTGLGGTSGGGSILSAAGISIAGFNYLTQGTASMSRMSVAQRTQIMNEAQSWLNKNNVDISTFQSQYKAYNDTLQKNIERANQTKIMAGEVSGSADALLSVLGTAQDTTPSYWNPAFNKEGEKITGTLGDLSSTNVLDLMAGKQVNSKFAQQYSFQIQAMANDLAGYFAAARGASSPEDSDKLDAANVISSGMNGTSVQAFKESIEANEAKVAGVVNGAVTNSQKQVWSLFGVGDKYANPVNTNDVILQQNQNDPGGIGDHLNTQTTDPTNPAGLSL